MTATQRTPVASHAAHANLLSRSLVLHLPAAHRGTSGHNCGQNCGQKKNCGQICDHSAAHIRARISGHNPELLSRLAPGRPAAQLPQLAAALYSLCGHAHRLTANAAVQAAYRTATPSAHQSATQTCVSHENNHSAEPDADPGSLWQLALNTARDQTLRIAQDWPRQLAPATADRPAESALDTVSGAIINPATSAILTLTQHPLWQQACGPSLSIISAQAQLSATADWLATHWLGCPAASWLASYDANPQQHLRAWLSPSAAQALHGAGGRPHALLRPLLHTPADWLTLPPTSPATPLGCTPTPPATLLAALANPHHRLHDDLVHQPDFATAPHLAGHAIDTGPWNRAAMQPAQSRAASASALDRLGARLADLVRLSLAGQVKTALPPLAHGARGWLSPDGQTQQGLAWTEMARGVLTYWVKLRKTGPQADAWTIDACRVLSPTAWNFHPQGTLAQALSQAAATVAPAAQVDTARYLALAWDPCMDFRIAPESESMFGAADPAALTHPPSAQEPAHA